MIKGLLLEVIGCMSILGILEVWIISRAQHIVGAGFVLAILGIYLMITRERKLITKSIRFIVGRWPESSVNQGIKYMVELRKLGVFMALSGLIGIPILIALSSWPIVGIKVIGESLAIMMAIVLYTLFIESFIVLPLLVGIKYRSHRQTIELITQKKFIKAQSIRGYNSANK